MIIIKHKKLIALFAAFSFLSLLQVSSIPLRAEQSTNQDVTYASNAEQGPNFIEQDGERESSAKKKSLLLPIILGVVAAGAVTAVLLLVVFKTKYDIRGTWAGQVRYDYQRPDYEDHAIRIVFTGTKTKGTFVVTDNRGTFNGTYDAGYKIVLNDVILTKNGGVRLEYYNGWNFVNLDGKFDSKNKISGPILESSFSWEITRQ